MALLNLLKKESSQIAAKLGMASQSMMGANFRTYGSNMGIYEFDDYVIYARRIYAEAMANPSGFTIIELPNGGKAVDFQGKLRGVYDVSGEPMAFFKPDYQQLGYADAEEELREFKSTVTTLH